MDIDKARELVVSEALKYLIDVEVIGVGTGSTVEKLINTMVIHKDLFRRKYFIASSLATALKLREAGFKVLDLHSIDDLDLYIDSADKVDSNLNLIKGGGAALTMEKLLSYYSKFNIYIIDYSKLVNSFNSDDLVPIDVLPQSVSVVINHLRKLGFKSTIRCCGKGKYGPVISDVGGVIIDVNLPVTDAKNEDLCEFNNKIRNIPGVIETGLFVGLSDLVLVGYKEKVDSLRGKRFIGMYHHSPPS
ncbi:MAG: ribose 5-phosphate isomerase A [Sulfolobales archaeon]